MSGGDEEMEEEEDDGQFRDQHIRKVQRKKGKKERNIQQFR